MWKAYEYVCVFVPLGDNLATGGPSTNVGGERNGLVSDPGRPRGEGPYNDLSARKKSGKVKFMLANRLPG